jgi:hypothetical protein
MDVRGLLAKAGRLRVSRQSPPRVAKGTYELASYCPTCCYRDRNSLRCGRVGSYRDSAIMMIAAQTLEIGMSTKWSLEVHDEPKGRGSILSFFEFDDFPTLRLKIVENRGRAFVVRLPDHARQTDLAGLLDLRSQGFKVERN